MTAKDIETFTWRSQLTPGHFLTGLAIAVLLVTAGYVMGKAAEDITTIAQVTPAIQMTSGEATAIKDQILAKRVAVTSSADAIAFHDRVFAPNRNALTSLGRSILLKDAFYGGDQRGARRGK